jgi:hypothetical protein
MTTRHLTTPSSSPLHDDLDASCLHNDCSHHSISTSQPRYYTIQASKISFQMDMFHTILHPAGGCCTVPRWGSRGIKRRLRPGKVLYNVIIIVLIVPPLAIYQTNHSRMMRPGGIPAPLKKPTSCHKTCADFFASYPDHNLHNIAGDDRRYVTCACGMKNSLAITR